MNMELAFVCNSPYELLKNIDRDHTGLFFLDIGLKTKMNGFMLAQEIRIMQPRCFIVFITSYAEMGYLTFQYKVEALDYIIKDNKENMHKRIQECIVRVDELYSTYDTKFQRIFVIKNSGVKLVTQYEDILFFETSINEHRIILYGKKQRIEFAGNLKDLLKELDDNFYRCHRSYIVNKSNIGCIDVKNRIIHMISGETCPVSVRLLKGLK